jgi:hypothetical protein
VIGDSGTGGTSARRVRDAYLSHAGTRRTDVWLTLGDNAYPDGTESDFQRAVFGTYPSLLRNTFVWPAFGNHDAHSASSQTQTGPYYDIFTLPRQAEAGGTPSGTEAYYSFDHGAIHFICLDSTESDRSSSGPMMSWLRADLASTDAAWVIAYMHHAPYSRGSHDSDTDSGMKAMRENALPILEAAGVDLVLGAHSHAYERSYLVDNYYGSRSSFRLSILRDRGDGDETSDGAYFKTSPGKVPHEGTVCAVVGSSGRVDGGPLDHPVMARSAAQLGSLVLDIDGGRLDGRFLDDSGRVVDHFVLHKGERRTLTRVEPRIAASQGGQQTLELAAGTAHAGRFYLLLGAFDSEPGFSLGSFHVPLNPDRWLEFTLNMANSTILASSAGHLGADGKARAWIRLPPLADPTIRGLSLFHAYLLVDPTGLPFPFLVSNAVRLQLE